MVRCPHTLKELNMFRYRMLFPLLAAAVLTAGCVSTNAVRLGGGPLRPPTAEDRVVIYRTSEQVPGKYEEIALINASGESSYTNEEQMFKAMRKKAAELGANAIVLEAVNEPGAGAKVAAAIFGVGANRKGKAIAIYVFPKDQLESTP